MKRKFDKEVFKELGRRLHEEEQAEKPGEVVEPWTPSLGPTQQKIFDCDAKWILVSGERGTGKTYGIIHKILRHCWEERNALALIVVGVRSQATQGGAWDKLLLEVAPEWKAGMGLEVTEERRDEQQYRYVFVRNRHGGWSKITLVSLPWPTQVRDRIKGFEPSLVFVDELVTLGGPAYFNAIAQQIGRRPGIEGPQQYIAATNPDGPRHWVYKHFIEGPYKETHDESGEVLSPEGDWDSRYQYFPLGIEENRHNLPSGYYQQIIEATKNDPIEYRRMVLGEWVDRPDGDALFSGTFHAEEHLIKGKKGKHLCPLPRFPVVMGYDLGQVCNAITFAQPVLTQSSGLVWLVFDELVLTNKKIPYELLVRSLMRKMKMWEGMVRSHLRWYHVSDDSAFNQFRPGSNGGSYDHLQIQLYSKRYYEEYGLEEPIRMVPSPKFQGSKDARVAITTQLLREGRLKVSEKCEKHTAMFLNLKSEQNKEGAYDPGAAMRPRRSVHLHPFDSMSYIFLEAELGPGRFVPGRQDKKAEIVSKDFLQ